MVRELVCVYVAVSARDGRMNSLILPEVHTSSMSPFLSHTAAAYAGEHCVMPMDPACCHIADEFEVPPLMTLLLLRLHSPERNPVQQVWKYYRAIDLRNHTFDPLDEVVDAVSSSLHGLHEHRNLVEPLTRYDRIKALALM